MKVSKIVVPLLAVSLINNPNIEQVRKTEVSHQVLKIENESVYFDLVANQKIIEKSQFKQANITQNELEKPTQAPTPDDCWRILQAALSSCALLGPFSPACVATAWVAFGICMKEAGGA